MISQIKVKKWDLSLCCVMLHEWYSSSQSICKIIVLRQSIQDPLNQIQKQYLS